MSWGRKLLGLNSAGPVRRSVRASYDAAQTTSENSSHWAWADSLNGNAAHDPATRQTLRERARYEYDNNGHAQGLIDKIAYGLVGTCPRLQLAIPGAAREACRAIELAYSRWCLATGLGAKLRLLHTMRVRDGEGFGLLHTNPALDPQGVQLDLRLYETDQVSTPFFLWTDPLAFDGGRLDESGNVVEWHLRRVHPGSNAWVSNYLAYERIPAREMVHWYRQRRAGQVRGVPEITAALPLFAQLRRYGLATLSAAELAAMLAGVLESDTPAVDGSPVEVASMDEVQLARGALLTLPAGWKASQFKPEQPTGTYREFKAEVLTEAGQPLQAPRNVATGSSAEYNYSSGRLDHLPYEQCLRVQRYDLRQAVLDPVFRAWLGEAVFVPGLLPDGLPPIAAWSWEWHYDGTGSIDPEKDAKTDDLELKNGTTTLAEIYARKGQDWEEQLRQRAREIALARELGLTGSGSPAPTPPQQTEEVADAPAA